MSRAKPGCGGSDHVLPPGSGVIADQQSNQDHRGGDMLEFFDDDLIGFVRAFIIKPCT
jgi:hypothetical protein